MPQWFILESVWKFFVFWKKEVVGSLSSLSGIITSLSSSLSAVSSLGTLRRGGTGCLNGGKLVTRTVSGVESLAMSTEGSVNVHSGGVGRTLSSQFSRGEGTLSSTVVRGGLRDSSVSMALPNIRLPTKKVRPLGRAVVSLSSLCVDVKCGITSKPSVSASSCYFSGLGLPGKRPTESVRSAFCVGPSMLLEDRASPIRMEAVLSSGKQPVGVVYPNGICEHSTSSTARSRRFVRYSKLILKGGVALTSLGKTLLSVTGGVFSSSEGVELHPSFFPFASPSISMSISYKLYKKGKYGAYGRAN